MKNATTWLTFALLCFAVGCSCSDDDKKPAGGDGGVTDDGSTLGDDGGDVSPFPTNDAGQVLCGDVPCQCSDGVDNDDDDLVDGLDGECTGPADNDEASFATGVPGDNVDPKWQDCFFDGNSGAGDDKCRYSTDCLTGDLPLSDPDCSVVEACVDFCAPRTPNGCDCFGCCEVTFTDDSTGTILISEPCDADDPASCTECVQTTECDNECGQCELCGGKTQADIDADPDCSEGYTCDGGEIQCPSGTNAECESGFSCQFGCCLPVVVIL